MSLIKKVDYSIIICTYNPDQRLLERCLNAIYNQNTEHLNVEVILVDNNSTVAISGIPFIKDLLEEMNNLFVLHEPLQGLASARTAGIRKAKGEWIVFFDDDNEPNTNYLQELARINKLYNHVVVWGPGNISVEFIDGIDGDIENYARAVFQEKRIENVEYASIRDWQKCYPFGTGMCIKATYLREYARLVEEGVFTASGRKGNLLTSGEDVQIVLFCIKQGLAAGSSPGLQLTHIIPAKRANYDYIKRLLFGAYLSDSTSVLEVFPDHRLVLLSTVLKASTFSRRSIKRFIKLSYKHDKNKMFEFITFIGNACGVYIALDRPVPSAVNWIIKRLKLN